MHRYIIKRLLMMIPVIIAVSFIAFFLVDLIPGDIVDYIAPAEATELQKETLREEMGLNRNVFIRYFEYMLDLFRGDLGTSYLSGESVLQVYMTKLPNTLLLAGASICVSIALSIPLGIYSALKRGTWKDNISMVIALIGLSIPNFWLGLILILVFSLRLGWLPSNGFGSPAHLVLPAVTIGTGLTALLTRTTRSSMLEVIRKDYLRTARAKGVSEGIVVRKHALGNALIPIITVIGMQFNECIGGAMLTETVFSLPGIGRLIVDSVNSRDVPMLTGSIILTTIIVSIVLLIVDLLYAFFDPRIKSQYSKGGA